MIATLEQEEMSQGTPPFFEPLNNSAVNKIISTILLPKPSSSN